MAALVALAVAAALPASSPVRAAGARHPDGLDVLFLAALAGAFVLYVVALILLRRAGGALPLVCVVGVAVQLLPLGGPLLLSRDVYSYWAYGRLTSVHHVNPYLAPPARFPHDPATKAVAPPWRADRSVYGPAFTGASAGVALIAGRSPARAAAAFRLTAAFATVGLVALAALAAPSPALAAAAVGWNPLFAVHFAGGGHNDVWMMVPVLAALALDARGRPLAAGASWALAVALKWAVLALLPLHLLASRGGARRRTAVGFAVAATALGVASSVAFGPGWLLALAPVAHRSSAFSASSRLVQVGVPRPLAAVAIGGAVAGALASLAWRARSGRARLGLATGLLLLGSPWILPWYSVWALPVAAAEGDWAATCLAVGLSAYLLPDRIPT